jgi:D-erythronate 2-dehydrogenase
VYGGALPDPVTDETPPSPRISYGAQKLVCEILIEVMVRPGGANTAVSGWASAIIREPLAGRDYVCPVRADTEMACISVAKVVHALIHASNMETSLLARNRAVLLEGIPVSAQEMWHAVKDRARGKATFDPDPALQAIMDGVPKATHPARAAKLGFPQSANIEEIVREHEEAAVPHHG